MDILNLRVKYWHCIRNTFFICGLNVMKQRSNSEHSDVYFKSFLTLTIFSFYLLYTSKFWVSQIFYFERWRSSARNRRTWSRCATPSLPSSTRVPEVCPEVSFGLLFVVREHCRLIRFLFLTPGSGIDKKSHIRSRDVHPGSQFQRAKDAYPDPESRIFDPGSLMEIL